MDVDNELEGNLLRQFSSLGTTDKEVLIAEFQKLLGPNQLSPEGCGFFLDMNNWYGLTRYFGIRNNCHIA